MHEQDKSTRNKQESFAIQVNWLGDSASPTYREAKMLYTDGGDTLRKEDNPVNHGGMLVTDRTKEGKALAAYALPWKRGV